MTSRIGMISLGCSKNQVDAEIMLGILSKAGFEIVSDSKEADIIIVNTCGFIGPAKEESIEAVLEQAQYKKAGKCKLLIMTGCLAERYQKELMDELPEVDAIIGTGNYTRILEVINQFKAGNRIVMGGNIDCSIEEGLPRILSTPGTTAYLKIAEGCDNHCTYCVIPQIRGKYRSRSFEGVIQEAKELVDKGVRELILIAQDITRYGQEFDDVNLAKLLRKLCEINDLKWIRLLYCYPERISEELIEVIAEEDKICKYLDIPIQHINDTILKRMNRLSTSASIKELLRRVKDAIPNIVLRTSLIVGFPGEKDEHFHELADFIQEFPFHHLGVFKYSPEEGTPAYYYENQVDEGIKEQRLATLMSIQKKISKKLNRSRIGEVCDVLIEGKERDDLYFGRSYAEAPEIDGQVYIISKSEMKIGDFVKTRITNAFDYDLAGEPSEFSE